MKKIEYTELHAHLSGSIPRDWLQRKAKELSIKNIDLSPLNKEKPDLKECFAIFPIIHNIIASEKLLIEATSEVLNNFYLKRVRHLELRTTPKGRNLEEKKRNIDLILSTGKAFTENHKDLKLSWIISINRAESIDSAKENLKIAAEAKEYNVVGIDLCGDPSVNEFSMFREVFEDARNIGLKTTIHCAELDTPKETDDIINFGPDRLGHAAILNSEQIEKIIEKKILVEVCLTSNITTKACEKVKDHPVVHWIKAKHPFCLCTDDISLFNMELYEEWDLLKEN